MPIERDFSKITLKPVTVTFFEMHQKPEEIFKERKDVVFRLLAKPVDPATYLSFYSEVGKEHCWLDRLVMDKEELYQLINADNIVIFGMYMNDQPAGYAELILDNKFTEILYFGLMPDFIGKGLGKYALDWAIHKAWSYSPQWIQLNTCELDHPHAISNYTKRGFTQVRTEVHMRKVIA